MLSSFICILRNVYIFLFLGQGGAGFETYAANIEKVQDKLAEYPGYKGREPNWMLHSTLKCSLWFFGV